jgi:hypothetical protein
MLGLAGALVPMRPVGGRCRRRSCGVALLVPAWQVVHLLNLVGTDGWIPGPGLLLVAGGGVLAAIAAGQLFRPPATD